MKKALARPGLASQPAVRYTLGRMGNGRKVFAAFAAVFALCGVAEARTYVLKAGLLYTCAGKDGAKPVENGVVVFRDGKITAVGKEGEVRIPAGAVVLDHSAHVVMPGMIDLHSHIGVYPYPNVQAHSDGNEMTDPFTPQVRAIDSFRTDDPAIAEAVAGGVTTVLARPGSGNIVGGQGVLVKMKPGRKHASDLVLKEPADIKMATEWNPILSYGGRGERPATRMDVFAMLRQELQKAKEYLAQWDDYEAQKKNNPKGAAEPPERNLKLEALGMLLKREIPAHIHTSRADEILNAVAVAEEFGIAFNMGHAELAFKVADILAEKNIVSVVGPRMFRPDPETNTATCIPCVMAEAGAPMAFQTDHPVVNQAYLLYQAALAVRYGTPEDVALRAITIVGAEAGWVADRIGSLETGKDADFVVLDGPLFEVSTNVVKVFIDGQVEYEKK